MDGLRGRRGRSVNLLVAGLVLFLGVHSVSIIGDGVRGAIVRAIGEGPWKGLYSLVAAVGLGLVVYGYGAARMTPEVLFLPPIGLRHATLALMVPVFPLLLAAYLPGRIRAAVRHPMLWSVTLWSGAHLLANGMVHDALLFGGFLAWSLLDLLSFTRRVQRPIETAPPSPYNDVIAVVAGLGLYAVTLLWGHLWLIGVPPLA